MNTFIRPGTIDALCNAQHNIQDSGASPQETMHSEPQESESLWDRIKRGAKKFWNTAQPIIQKFASFLTSITPIIVFCQKFMSKPETTGRYRGKNCVYG